MKKTTFIAVFLTAFLFLGFQAIILGQSLLTEDFNYSAGDLLTNHSWTAHSSGGTQPITVSSVGLSFPGYASSGIGNAALVDNNGEDDNLTFTPQTSGSVYVGFMVKVVANAAGYFFHIGQTPIGTTYRGKVFTDATNHFGLSVANNTGTFSSSTFTVGSTYMLVLKYEIVSGASNDKVSLFVFDTSLPAFEPGSPTIGPLTEAVTDITPSSVALRQYSASQNFLIDGIVVGKTWSDIAGDPIIAPTIQASNLVFSNNTGTGITNSWTNGDGSSRVTVISSSPGITAPANGTDPTGNTLYSGSGQQVIYNGTGNSVTVSGLQPSTTYWFQVFEYNGLGVNTKYSTATGIDNPMSQSTIFVATAPQMGSPSVSSISSNSAILGGEILSDGGSPLSERGTLWSINTPVTIADNKLPEGGTASGTFSHLRSSLPTGIEVFYAAYAINGIGTTLSPESIFTTLAEEPGSQASNFTSTTSLSTSITVSWSDNDGIQPASGFLILANTSGTFTAPVDGTAQSNDTILVDGSSKVNVAHGIQSYTWIGLNPSTTYYFSIYPYTNSGTNIDYKTTASPPITSATTEALPTNTYTWSGANNGAWTTATNWTPTRNSPATTDILQFSNGSTFNITAVPTETISQLIVSGNTKVTLLSSSAVTLTINGSAGTNLEVPSGCELNLSGANAIIVSLANGSSGSITGSMTLSSGAHRLLSASASGILFNSNSTFKAATGLTGSPFGTAAPYNAVVFSPGSTYISQAGSNPFGASAPNSVVTFQSGSLFKVIAGVSPAFSGRTYANFEMDAPGSSITPTGSSAVSIQNLTITNGTLNFNMTGTPGHSIRGNIYVAAGATLNFSPATAGTISLNGTASQTISGGGSINWGSLSTLNISNPATVNLMSSATLSGVLSLNALFELTTGNFLLGPAASISGTPSASAMIVATNIGQLRKEMPANGGAFTFPVGDNIGTAEYSPLTLNFTAGTFGSGNYIGVNLANTSYPGNPLTGSYLNRYWTVSSSGISGLMCDATFSYVAPADVTGDENLISCVQMLATPVVYNPANTLLHQLTATNLSSLGSFTGMQSDRSLDLTLYLEGIYAGGGMMNKAQDASGDKFPGTTADEVIIDLHSSAPGDYSAIEYSSGLVNLNTSGHVNISIPFVHSGSYYISVRHRNSIETVSALPVSFSGNAISYSFTDALSRAYGNNLIPSNDGNFLLYGGDVNQDGVIDSGDMIPIDNDGSSFATGYINTDVNGDGLVDLTDMILIDNHSAAFVSSITP